MKTIHVTVTTTESMLGSAPNNKELMESYIASKAPDAMTMAEEIEAVGAEEVLEKAMTVFPRHEGKPICMITRLKVFLRTAAVRCAR